MILRYIRIREVLPLLEIDELLLSTRENRDIELMRVGILI
jgi:hypothetical protein